MNALNMKLESKEIDLGSTEICKEANGKKCSKSGRKKVNPLNIDKESLSIGNGLGCESSQFVDTDSKQNSSPETNNLKKRRGKKLNCEDGKMLTKSDKIQERLQQSLSEESKKKISAIINDIKVLSDVEKLFLYLQLPTGSSLDEDPLKQKSPNNPLGKKADEEGTLAVTWIQSHLEEDPDVSLPKQEVYDEYQSYCEVTKNEPLCAADFGKVMKQIFPSVKPRRLGTRGNSRYCYSGLRKKLKVHSPSLPDLQVAKDNCMGDRVDSDDEVITASCHVLFEWTEKLLGNKFTSLKELASHLIENMYVDNRSVAAFTVLLSTSPQQLDRGPCSVSVKWENGTKKSETQLHLQRKIQEKELIKEQKRKLQEQRSSLLTIHEGNCIHPKRKGMKGKKSRLHSASSQSQKDKESVESSVTTSEECQSTESKLSVENSAEEINTCEENESNTIEGMSVNNSSENVIASHTSQPNSSCSSNEKIINLQKGTSVLVNEECTKKKQRNKIAIATRNKTPVCISQSLPSFIIVPSLSQVQLAEIGSKSCNKTPPKYKRIQPKPLSEITIPSMIRCRAGSLGSAILKETKLRTDGRRSSHSWLQSDGSSSQEYKEEPNSLQEISKSLKSFANSTKQIDSKTAMSIKSETDVQDDNIEKAPNRKPCISNSMKVEDVNFEAFSHTNSYSESDQGTRSVFLNDLRGNLKQNVILQSNIFKRLDEKAEVPNDDCCGTKRHSEECDIQVVTKKPHLEELISSEISNESLSPWTKDYCRMNCELNSSLGQNNAENDVPSIVSKQDEVSIHELESDALIEYLHGARAETYDSSLASNPCMIPVPSSFISTLQRQKTDIDESFETQIKQPLSNNKVKQLSQLRMLLEQNLPRAVTKSSRIPKEQTFSLEKQSVVMHTNVLPLQGVCRESSNRSRNNCSISIDEMPKVLLRNNDPHLISKGEIESNLISEFLSKLKSGNFPHTDSQFGESIMPTTDDISSQTPMSEQELLTVITEPGALPSFTKNDSHLINLNSHKVIHNLTQNNQMICSPSLMASDAEQLYNVINVERSSTQTQVPSVPPSPNTRRRAFNFMPISPRHTPVPEGMITTPGPACYSPVPSQIVRNMVSIAVGPSQPPSNAGSPFVSPRSTPVPPSRSRHNSGQSTYSTSRHTPFQNLDSGVSSISSSPFISPQPTPVPVSRLRHNSSHGPCKTVTFSTVNNPQVIHTQSSVIGHGPLRLRHSSGPGGPHLGVSLLSPRSAPLSPLVSENCSQTNFTFPTVNETRSRHNSGSTTTPLSPVSEQVSPTSSCASNHLPDMPVASENLVAEVRSFLNENCGREINLNPPTRPTRQRHFSSSVIYNKPISLSLDPLSQEVQLFLKNGAENVASNVDVSSRSRSVPLHQMLRNLATGSTTSGSSDNLFSKSYLTATATSSNLTYPMLDSSPATASLPITSDSLILQRDKTILQSMPNDWSSLSDIEISSARRNLAGLFDAPLGDDLQATIEDLRDCDTDFSKFSQEYEDFNPNEDGGL